MQFECILLALDIVLGTLGLITAPAASRIVTHNRALPNIRFGKKTDHEQNICANFNVYASSM